MRKEGVFAGRIKRVTAAAALILLTVSASAPALPQDQAPAAPAITQTKFYCNMKALTPTRRAHHQELTDKIIAARTAIVVSEEGYEFQFAPTNITLAELADWSVAESKCCPFFDFHIDLEREGTLLCLRLTGQRGIKRFIREEFQVPAK